MLPLRPALRLSLLATALVAANLVHAEVPAGAPFTPEQQLVLEKYQSGLADKAEDVASKLDKLEARLQSKQEYDKDVLALGQKNIDWMLGFLGLTLAAAAFLGWRTKARIESEWVEQKQQMDKAHQQAVADADKAREALTQEVGRSLAEARERLRELREELKHARSMNTEIRQVRDSAVTPRADAPAAEIEAAQKENEANAAHSPQSKLAALAQKFDQEGNWQEAASRWQALTDLEPENASYWFNYGYALNQWIKQSKEAVQIRSLVGQAQAAWRHVVALRPDDASAYNNWGTLLGDWAKTLTGEEQQQCFAEANQRYDKATRLQPDVAAAYNNWGGVLVEWALTLQSDDRINLLARAEEVLMFAKGKGNTNVYNLACLRAMQQRYDEARDLLLAMQAASALPDFAHLSTDKTLAHLRGQNWFDSLLDDVGQQQQARETQPA